MADFWGNLEPNDIIDNNDNLENKIDSLKDWTSRIDGSREELFSEIKEIIAQQFSYFKKRIRFPTKEDREEQWDRFHSLKQEAFDIYYNQKHENSFEHYQTLMELATEANCGLIEGTLFTNLLDKNELKEKALHLKEAWAYYKEHKYQMSKEHRDEVVEVLLEIREKHNDWWDDYNKFVEEKRDAAKEKIESILGKKSYRLHQSKDYLDRLESKKGEIEGLIADAWNDNFRQRQEDRLDEIECKIQEVEEQISELEEQISELEDKLSNWN